MSEEKCRVFVASSVEGLDIAYGIQENLEHFAEITVWSQGIFDLSDFVLEDLVKQIDEFDFAIFVFSFEDITRMRNIEERTTRDNVVFELGLFIGGLTRQRCFIVMPRSSEKLHMPTDLLGINTASFDPTRKDGNLQAALGPACNQIRRSINKYGCRKREKTDDMENIIKQSRDAGLTAFYQSRDDYGKYRKDASSIDRYVSTANISIHMVSINLMTGLPFDGLISAVLKKIEATDNFMFVISLLNPWRHDLMLALSPVLDVKPDKLSDTIKYNLEELSKAREQLPAERKSCFVIKIHDAIPFGSAILLDVLTETGKIQIETKAYKTPVRKSIAFEVTYNSSSVIYETLKDGYCRLIDEAQNYEDMLNSVST